MPEQWVRTIEADDFESQMEEAEGTPDASPEVGTAVIGGVSRPYSTTSVMGPRGKIVDVVRDWREALNLIKDHEHVAWDLETGGLNPWRDPIAVLSLFGAETRTPCILHFRGQMPTEVKRFLQMPRLWIDHNGTNFDRPYLSCNGVDVFRAGVKRYDTLVGEACTKTSGRHDVRLNLQAVLARRVGRKITKDADHESWMNESLDPTQIAYCVDDVQFLPSVMEEQVAKTKAEGRYRSIEVEQELTQVVTAMIITGLPLDLDALSEWHRGSQERIKAAGERLTAVAGDINYNSPVQLKKAFSVCFNVDMPSTKAEVLDNLGQYDTPIGQFCRDIKVFRQGTKRTGMYDQGWMNKFLQYDGRIHARFWQVGTETGRFSSTDPNFQQWPRDGRSVIGGEDGMEIIAADYDAIEVMVAAGLAGDTQLLEDCLDDPHIRLAMAFSGVPRDEITSEVRRIAKSGNFVFLFGGGVKRFHEACLAGGSTMSRGEARQLMDWYLRRYPGISKMRDLAFRKADSGKVKLDFPTGLRRVMVGPEVTPTRILNNVVQGTAAAGMKYAMLELYRRGLVHGYLGATIHDELVSNVPIEEADEYQAEMVDAMIVGMERAIRGIPTRAGVKRGSHWR
jgi:DNA polymerase-1